MDKGVVARLHFSSDTLIEFAARYTAFSYAAVGPLRGL